MTTCVSCGGDANMCFSPSSTKGRRAPSFSSVSGRKNLKILSCALPPNWCNSDTSTVISPSCTTSALFAHRTDCSSSDNKSCALKSATPACQSKSHDDHKARSSPPLLLKNVRQASWQLFPAGPISTLFALGWLPRLCCKQFKQKGCKTVLQCLRKCSGEPCAGNAYLPFLSVPNVSANNCHGQWIK